MTENDTDDSSSDDENDEDEFIVTTQIRRNVDVEVTAKSPEEAHERAIESAQEVAPAGFTVSPIIVEYADGNNSKRIMEDVKRSVVGTDEDEPADSVQRRLEDEANADE